MLASSRVRSSGGSVEGDITGFCRRCLGTCQCDFHSVRHAADNYRSMFRKTPTDEQWERDSLEDIDRKVKNRILRRNILKRLTKETESTRNRRSTTVSSLKRPDDIGQSECAQSRSRSSSTVRSMSSDPNNLCKSHTDSKQAKTSKDKSICNYFSDSKFASLKPMVLNFHRRYALPYPSKNNSRKNLDNVNKYSSALKKDFKPLFLDRPAPIMTLRVGNNRPPDLVDSSDQDDGINSEYQHDVYCKSDISQGVNSLLLERGTASSEHSHELLFDADSGLSYLEAKTIDPSNVNVESEAEYFRNKNLSRSCEIKPELEATTSLSPLSSLYRRMVSSPLGSISSSSGVTEVFSGSDTTKIELNSTGEYEDDVQVTPCPLRGNRISETLSDISSRSSIGSCENTSDSRSSLVAKFHEKYSSIFKSRNSVSNKIDRIIPHSYDLIKENEHKSLLGSNSALSTNIEYRHSDFRISVKSPCSVVYDEQASSKKCFSPVLFSSGYSDQRSSPGCSHSLESERQSRLVFSSHRSGFASQSSYSSAASHIPLVVEKTLTKNVPSYSDMSVNSFGQRDSDYSDTTEGTECSTPCVPNTSCRFSDAANVNDVAPYEALENTQAMQMSAPIHSDATRVRSHSSSETDLDFFSSPCASTGLTKSSENQGPLSDELGSSIRFDTGLTPYEFQSNNNDTSIEKEHSISLQNHNVENLSSSEFDKSRDDDIVGNTEPDNLSFDRFSLKRCSSANVINGEPHYDSFSGISCGLPNCVRSDNKLSPFSSSTNNISAMDFAADRGMGRKVFSCDVGAPTSPRKSTSSSKQWFRKFSSIGHISPVAQSHLRLKRRPSKMSQANGSRLSLGAKDCHSTESVQGLNSSINGLEVNNERLTNPDFSETATIYDSERLGSCDVSKVHPASERVILLDRDRIVEDEYISDQAFPDGFDVNTDQPSLPSVREMLPPEAAVAVGTASIGLAGVPSGFHAGRARPAVAVTAMVRHDVSSSPDAPPARPPQLDLRQQEQLLTVDRSIDRLMKERDRLKSEIAACRAQSVTFQKRIAEKTVRTAEPVTRQLESRQQQLELDRARLLRERDEAREELTKMQTLFSDLNRKFEKSRGHLAETDQQCSLTMVRLQEDTASLSTQNQKYQLLLQHSQDKLLSLNAEREELFQTSERELLQMRAKLRLKENKLGKLEQENQDLTKLCDELIAKMGDANV